MSRITFNSNLLSLNAQRRLFEQTKELQNTYTKLSSGLRINKASDDAAGLSVSSLLNVDRRVGSQGLKNLNDGISLLSIAEGATNELGSILSRLQELAEQSSNGVFSSTQRSALNKESEELKSEYERIINSTTFNGINLFKDADANVRLQSGYGSDGALHVDLSRSDPYGVLGTTSSSGQPSNLYNLILSISSDGRYVLFATDADNLVSDDSNGYSDIFRKDMSTGETIRVSTSSSGAQGNNNAGSANISDNGQYVVFSSSASNLVSGDTNAVADVFVKNILTGETTIASTASSSEFSNSSSDNGKITQEGRYVFYHSGGNNLVTGDTNGRTDVFRKDLLTGENILVSTTSTGGQISSNSTLLDISSDGRYVLFTSSANDIVPEDTNSRGDIFRKDMQTGETIIVSTSATGTLGNDYSGEATISEDGRYVAFTSYSSNLVSGDTNSDRDIFRKDITTGEIELVSGSESGAFGDLESNNPQISSDGRYIAFSSQASNLDPEDLNGVGVDIFVRDMRTGKIAVASRGESGGGNDGLEEGKFAFSGDASTIFFETFENPNLLDGQTIDFYQGIVSTNPLFYFENSINSVGGISLASQSSAQNALNSLENSMRELTSFKAKIGAYSSRIQSSYSNLETQVLNYTDASSRITDTDVAEESANLVRQQILQNITTSILGQANQQPEIGLQLLKKP